MFIDIHVHPAFFEPICHDAAKIELRHNSLNIHRNSPAPLEHIFNQMRCAKLDKLCLLPQDYTASDGRELVTNEEIHELVKLAPEQFIGFASIDPRSEDCLTKLQKAFSELDLKGLKLHPGRQKFYPGDTALNPIYEMCEYYNKPVIFHSGMSWEPDAPAKYSRPIEFEELAISHPKLRFCLAHMGWPWVKETAMLLLKYRNVYADTALLHFDCAREFFTHIFTEEIPLSWIDRSLRNKIMFGSNNPRFEQIRMVQAFELLGLRSSTVDLIMGKNAVDFLGGLD